MEAKHRLRGGRPAPGTGEPDVSILAANFERALSRKIKRGAAFCYPVFASAERNIAYATSYLLRLSEGKRVVHHASVIADLGMKARIITIPPAAVFARGDLVRQVLWPAVLKRLPQCLPYAPATEESILRRLSGWLHESKIFLSADLTCATDGFGHDAILAVITGLSKAGLPAYLCSELRESLGVGKEFHYVRYRLLDMEPSEAEYCRKRYPVVDGYVEVAKSRGSLMGTPCSFSILSILNHWMSDRLGPARIICGDDLAAVTHRDNVSSYSQRARAIGSELHEGKSYRSRIGFVFCEAYALLSREGSISSFRPPSLKEFVRDGNGVMSQHAVDSSSFNRLARCARTIYRTQRKVASKRHRPPELPASLGGLGHPCKGRLRVPMWCRAALMELYLCTNAEHGGPHDPKKFIRTLIVPAIPHNRALLKESRRRVEEHVADRHVEFDDAQPGDSFVTRRDIDTYVSMSANVVHLARGGRFKKVRPQDINPGKQRWPKPCANRGVLSTHTRIREVLEWDRRARCELGTYFPEDFSAHIRGRISAYRYGDVPEDAR